MILDTSFAIDLLRGDEGAAEKAEQLEHEGEIPLLPAPVIFELFVGVARSDASLRERRRVELLAKSYGWIALDHEEARTAGEILGELMLQGTPIGLVDSMIAGIALEHDEVILTKNPREFERVPELKTETY